MRTQGVLVRLFVMMAAGSPVAVLPAVAAAQPIPLPPAATWHPIGVHVECQSFGRTHVCPSQLIGAIGEEPLLVQAGPEAADVIVWVNVAEAGTKDLMHLSFTSERPEITAKSELVVELDIYATVDELRATLHDAIRRGIAPFVAARYPDAVRVELVPPAGERAAGGSPWDFSIGILGLYSRDSGTSNVNAGVELHAARTTHESVATFDLNGMYVRSRRDDIPDDQEHPWWFASGQLHAEQQLLGALWLGGFADVHASHDGFTEYRSARAHALASFRLFPVDDPRGNSLTVAYAIGGGVQRTHFDGGETTTEVHPTHGVGVFASIRIDRLRIGGGLTAFSRLDTDEETSITGFQHVEWRFKPDLDIGFVAQEMKLDWDSVDYPLWVLGSFFIRVHWDRSNGARDIPFTSPLSMIQPM